MYSAGSYFLSAEVVIGFIRDTFLFTESEDAVVQVSVVGEVAQELTIILQQGVNPFDSTLCFFHTCTLPFSLSPSYFALVGAPYTSVITTTLGPGDINQIANITLMIPGNDIALQPTVTVPVSLSVPAAIQSGVQIGGQIDSMTLFGSSSVEISDDDSKMLKVIALGIKNMHIRALQHCETLVPANILDPVHPVLA